MRPYLHEVHDSKVRLDNLLLVQPKQIIKYKNLLLLPSTYLFCNKPENHKIAHQHYTLLSPFLKQGLALKLVQV